MIDKQNSDELDQTIAFKLVDDYIDFATKAAATSSVGELHVIAMQFPPLLAINNYVQLLLWLYKRGLVEVLVEDRVIKAFDCHQLSHLAHVYVQDVIKKGTVTEVLGIATSGQGVNQVAAAFCALGVKSSALMHIDAHTISLVHPLNEIVH